MIITKNSISINLQDDNYKSFWLNLEKDNWEKETFEIIDIFFKGGVFIDIGAWIGPISLYVANRATKIVAVEPDVKAFNTLKNNILLNNNITNIKVENVAIGNREEVLRLFHRTESGDSMSSFLSRPFDNGKFEEVKVVPLNTLLEKHDISKIDFIKIDIEGGEFKIISSLLNIVTKDKPTIFLSLHTPFLIENYFKSFFSSKVLKLIYRLNHISVRFFKFSFVNLFFRKKLSEDFQSIIEMTRYYNYIYTKNGDLIKVNSYKDIFNLDTILLTNQKW